MAEPTIFGEGILVGSKSVRLHAIDAATGEDIYTQDTGSEDCADEACRTGRNGNGEGQSGTDGSVSSGSRGGQLLLSRADFSVRVLEKFSGRQRWNVSLAQYSLEYTGGPAGLFGNTAGMSSTPNRRLGLQLQQGNVLCALPTATNDHDAGGDEGICTWRRTFSSPPVLMYRVDTSTGLHQQLTFLPRTFDGSTGLPQLPDEEKLSAALTLDGSYDYRAGFDVTPSRGPVRWSGERVHSDDDQLAVAVQEGDVRRARLGEHRFGDTFAFYSRARLGAAEPLLPLLPYVSNYLPIRLPLPAALPAPEGAVAATALAPFRERASATLRETSMAEVDVDALLPGRKVVVASMAHSLDEAPLLSDASLREMIAAVRHRFSGWKRENPSKVSIIIVAATAVGAFCVARMRRSWRRRRSRKAKSTATQAAAAALLERPESPDALSALTVVLAQADDEDTGAPEALRLLSVALGVERGVDRDEGYDGPSASVGLPPIGFRRVNSTGLIQNRPSPTPDIFSLSALSSEQRSTALSVRARSRYAQEFEQGTRLGKGGFGRVYRARHILDGVEYAIKKVLLTGSVREQERAVREAMCLAKLDHANVVRYYQVWKEDVDEDRLPEFDDSDEEFPEGSSYTEDDSHVSSSRCGSRHRWLERSPRMDGMASLPGASGSPAVLHIQMQLCELTLRDYLSEDARDRSLEASKPYFLQLLAGLHHIHRNSLIHRDLTPANVFITNDRQVIKIGDFGLSREMTSDLPVCPSSAANLEEKALAVSRGERRENARSVTRGVGTTLYMSPELRGCKPYDHKVDIYSAGVLLLEMCHRFDTAMERVVVLSNLQRHVLPNNIAGTPEGELVLSMTHEHPESRPSVEALLAAPALAVRGHICISVHRRSQYALMPLIREQIEGVVRVRSFTAHDTPRESEPADVDLVELEYFIEERVLDSGSDGGVDVEKAPLHASEARHRQSVERLRSGLGAIEGVTSVRGSVFAASRLHPSSLNGYSLERIALPPALPTSATSPPPASRIIKETLSHASAAPSSSMPHEGPLLLATTSVEIARPEIVPEPSPA